MSYSPNRLPAAAVRRTAAAAMGGVPQKTNGKAIWSPVLGIVGLVCCGFLAGIPAIILGTWPERRSARAGAPAAAWPRPASSWVSSPWSSASSA